jgi:dTMP kinase
MNRTGFFVCFEGIDGTGKSTQVARLRQSLEELGKTVVLSREPGGCALSEKIRGMILNEEMMPRTEALLFAAQRAETMALTIRPALESRKVVIADRYLYSSIAYQGAGLNLGPLQVANLSIFAANGLMPDLQFYFKMDPEAAVARMDSRKKDRIEERGIEFQRKIADEYEYLYRGVSEASGHPQLKCPTIMVDASRSIEEVSQLILQNVLNAIPK